MVLMAKSITFLLKSTIESPVLVNGCLAMLLEALEIELRSSLEEDKERERQRQSRARRKEESYVPRAKLTEAEKRERMKVMRN